MECKTIFQIIYTYLWSAKQYECIYGVQNNISTNIYVLTECKNNISNNLNIFTECKKILSNIYVFTDCKQIFQAI